LSLLLAGCGAPAAGPAPSAAASKPASSPVASAQPSASAAAKPAASGLAKIRFSYPVATGAWVPFMIGKDAGIFEKHGIDLDIVMLRGDLQVPSVLSGETNLAGTSAETIVSATLGGAQLTVFGAMIPHTVGYLWVSGDINKVEDLKGQTVVLNSFGNVAEFALRRILADHGLQFQKDVMVRAVQTTPAQIATLAAGDAKGFIAYPPDDVNAKRARPDSHALFDFSQLNLPYVQASLFGSKSYVGGNRDLIVRFMRATGEAIAREQKEPDFAAQIFQKYAKIDDRETALRGVTFYANVAQVPPAVNPEGVKNVLQVVAGSNPAAANLDPKTFIDSSIAEDAAKGLQR
jgi:NitT/TauT family transport system substrate-binding protein